MAVIGEKTSTDSSLLLKAYMIPKEKTILGKILWFSDLFVV